MLIVDDLVQLETAWLLLAVRLELGNQRMRKGVRDKRAKPNTG